MLEKLPSIATDETIYRYANQRKAIETLQKMGLDPDAIGEMLDLLGAGSEDVNLEGLLDAPFDPKPQLERRFPEETRYSDGSWRVSYNALERETAEKEVYHHYVKSAVGDLSKKRPAYYSSFSSRFRGIAKDLRPKLDEWPLLTHGSDYSFCQVLGREAVSKFDGLLAPSARREGGTTVPVFNRRALSNPVSLGDAAFSIDVDTGEIKVIYV